jgi:hypothetical protein
VRLISLCSCFAARSGCGCTLRVLAASVTEFKSFAAMKTSCFYDASPRPSRSRMRAQFLRHEHIVLCHHSTSPACWSFRAPEAIGILMGLVSKKCGPATAQPLNEKERERMRNQVPGWRVVDSGNGALSLTQDWTAQVQAPPVFQCLVSDDVRSLEGSRSSISRSLVCFPNVVLNKQHICEPAADQCVCSRVCTHHVTGAESWWMACRMRLHPNS